MYNDFILFLVFIIFSMLISIRYSSMVGVFQTMLHPTEVDKFDCWISHFNQAQVDTAARGDKALANPFDDSSLGIPNDDELEILKQKLENLGYKTHINKTFREYQGLPHLTVVWE